MTFSFFNITFSIRHASLCEFDISRDDIPIYLIQYLIINTYMGVYIYTGPYISRRYRYIVCVRVSVRIL